MKPSRIPLVSVALVGTILFVAGCGQDQQSAADAVREFYAWYARPVAEGGAETRFDRALEERREFFSVALRDALEADRAAQAAVPGAIVGLDFDPLTASQDPCERYLPDSVAVAGERVRVSVREECREGPIRPTPLTLEMLPVGGAWQVADIVYRDGDRLTAILARYRASREANVVRAPDDLSR